MGTSGVKQRQIHSNLEKHRKMSVGETEHEKVVDEQRRPVIDEKKATVVPWDLGTKLGLLCFCLSLLLSWLHLQQSVELEEMRSKYENLHKQSQGIQMMEDQIKKLSLQCPRAAALASEVEGYSQHQGALVDEVSLRISSLSTNQKVLQQRISILAKSLEESEQRITLINSDAAHKASSIRTDLRRMDGLATDVELLLNKTLTLEQRLSLSDNLMVRKIGDALAASIERVSHVKSTVQTQSHKLEEVEQLTQELTVRNRELADRILSMESGRANLIKMAVFAQELRPKVSSVRQEMVMIELMIDNLTLRIGELAEDMKRREAEEQKDVRSGVFGRRQTGEKPEECLAKVSIV